ncbi:MAG TPA: DUF5615 family PIN-like protein, partial [Tepidisphaeraceae bacterium]
GHDADHVSERGPVTMPDEQVMRLAQAEQRVLVTFDLDFTHLLALQRASQPSVILFRVDSIRTDRMSGWLADLLKRYEADLSAGAILVVENERERLRTLPVW